MPLDPLGAGISDTDSEEEREKDRKKAERRQFVPLQRATTVMVGGEFVDVSKLSDEEYHVVLNEKEYFLRYAELDRVHGANRDSGKMDWLEEKEDESGERMPAPEDYPKVPRRTRRGSHYF